MSLKNFYFLFSFFLLSFVAFGQSEQEDFLEAKRLFNSRQYLNARATFSNVARSATPLAPYAGFYYGLSAFNMGDPKAAVDMWKQMVRQFPDWDKMSELYYWLAYTQLQNGSYVDGITYASKLTDITHNISNERKMLDNFVLPLSIDSISDLLRQFPQNLILAELYVKKTNSLPYNQRDFEALDSINNAFNLDENSLREVSLPVIRKEEYKVAALLPFMFESLNNPGRVLQNSLVTDLYQGMLMAVKDLEKVGKPVNLVPYDTKRDEATTNEILQSAGFIDVDLIIGPLYSGPVKAVQDYSMDHQLNMLNPISSTSEIIGRNPYSFLYQPTIETEALKLADLVISECSNKNTMIFYESNGKDSLAATLYREKIEAAGFDVIWMQPIHQENAKLILDTLVAQYDVFYTRKQADSVSLLPDRVVKTRRIRDSELARIWKNDPLDTNFIFLPISYDDNNREIVYYEKQFYMERDSIGHFFAAVNDNVLASNLVSAVEIRGDSTTIYTYGSWLDYTMADYRQFERLGITIASPKYIDKNRISYQSISQKISNEYKTIPSIYHYTGYELIWYLGNQLHASGKYFQRGVRDGRIYYGKVFEGSIYGSANDNQVVPIVRFKSHELEVVNRDLYEN